MKPLYLTILIAAIVFCSISPLHVLPQPWRSEARLVREKVERGIASWYGPRFHGRLMANGKIYNMHVVQAAHKKLPLGTLVEVINLRNHKSILVCITDRGPYIRGRIIDLSYAAAKELDMIGHGVVQCIIRRVR